MFVVDFKPYIQYLHFWGFVYCLHTDCSFTLFRGHGVFKIGKCFEVFYTDSFFFTGQLSSYGMFALIFLSSFSLLHWYNRWSTFWFPLTQAHSGDCIILKRYRYDLVFPCAVVIAVKLGVRLIFVCSLSLIFEKNCLVASPLVVWSHCCCHFYMLFSLSWWSILLFRILL